MKSLRPLLRSVLIALIALAGLLFVFFRHARSLHPEFPSEAEISPRSGIRPGDEVTAEFTALIPSDRRILSSGVHCGKNLVSAGPVRRERIRRRWGEAQWRFCAVMRAVRSGEAGEGKWEIETVPLIGGNGKERFTVVIPDFTISFPAGETPDGKLISAGPPAASAGSFWVRSRWHWLWLLLIPVLWFLFARRARRKEKRILTAWEKALQEVGTLQERLRKGEVTPDRAFALLCDIVREYLEARFALPVSRRTTDEFLASLAVSPLPLDPGEERFLTDFLRAADLVKFAAFPAGPEQVNTAAEKAALFVRRTVPQPEKQPASQKRTKENSSHGI